MSEPIQIHDHPAVGPVVVVHIKDGDEPISSSNPAHAFGPYPSEAAARETEARVDDSCHKIILDVIEPLE